LQAIDRCQPSLHDATTSEAFSTLHAENHPEKFGRNEQSGSRSKQHSRTEQSKRTINICLVKIWDDFYNNKEVTNMFDLPSALKKLRSALKAFFQLN
jgi:hypothetical protein